MEIIFVLSHPAVPENIGFAARALNTTGFSKLRLVNPADHLSKEAKKTAYGSHAILEKAELFASLEDALHDIDLSIGTTAKNRLSRHDYHTPEEIGKLLLTKAGVANKVAIVFGSERDGLTAKEIDRCDLLSTIPLPAPHPSFNLAQSVLLYAWEMSKVNREKSPHLPTVGEVEQRALREEAKALLLDLGVDKQPSLYHRLKDRLMTANAEDTRLMLALARFLRHRLRKQ